MKGDAEKVRGEQLQQGLMTYSYELSKILSSITNILLSQLYDRNRGLRTIKHIQLVSLSPEKNPIDTSSR